MLRCHLHANNIPQADWRKGLKEMVFALNTTISCVAKCVPHEVIHGREVILPADVKLGTSTEKVRRDILSANDFAKELKPK